MAGRFNIFRWRVALEFARAFGAACFINNVPLAVSGNAGTWESQSFTITGNPATYIETEGTGRSFTIMNDAQFLAFQAGNANGYHGGGYSYTYALGGTNGGPSTEIEGEMLLNSGHWNLVWINDTGGWAGGAANISAFGSSGALTPTSGPTTPSSGDDLWVTLNDITTNMGIGNPSTTTIAGGYVNLHYTLYNTFATSQPASIQLYVSNDPTITTSDTPNADAPVLGTIFFDPIPANGSLEGTTTLHLLNNVLAGHLPQSGSAVFIGASDAPHKGVWQWVTGPEAGTTFWNGEANGSAVSGRYANWSPGEPNNVRTMATEVKISPS